MYRCCRPIAMLVGLVIVVSPLISIAEVKDEELKLRIETLEKVIQKNQKKTIKRLASLKSRISRENERLKINGFLTAGVVKGEKDFYNGTEEKPLEFSENLNFRTDSVAAIQFNYRLSDSIETILQLVATGYNEFDIEAEWGYLKYSLTDDWSIRAGRLRLPFFLYSETIAVGFTFPTVRPQLGLYVHELTVYEGIDTLYRFNLGGWTHFLQVFIGGSSSKDFKLTDLYGANIQSDTGPWSLRISFSQGKVDVNEFPDFGVDKALYLTGSVSYDDGVRFATFEINELDPNTGPVVASVSWYLQSGWRIGKWSPYLSIGQRYSTEKNDWEFLREAVQAQGNISEEYNTKNFQSGVRYSLTSNVALKFEYTRIFDFHKNSQGVVAPDPIKSHSGETFVSEDAVADIYSFTVNAIF